MQDEITLVAPLVACGALPSEAANECLRAWQALAKEGRKVPLLAVLVKRGLLTRTQAIVLAGTAVVDRQPFERYRLLRRVDEGGMAVVYEATYVPTNARVALKILRTEYCLQEAYRLRFKREANVLLHLDHPNIVEGREYGTQDGVDYYAMGFVDGISVQAILDHGQPLDVGLALHVATQVAEALEHMREKGIVHRDIKPGNLILDQAGKVCIIDFGLAKVMGGMWQDTTDATTVGTLEYMSPEQARGESDVDIRSDLYSLGVALYQMVTGELPFTGTAAEVMFGHVKKEVEIPVAHRGRVPAPVQYVIRRTMAKDPAHRYATPQQMLDDLHALCAPLIAARAPVPSLVQKAAIEAAPIGDAKAPKPTAGVPPRRAPRPSSSGSLRRQGRRPRR